MAAPSALCLSFSSHLHKPVFLPQRDSLCSVCVCIQLALWFCRGANTAVICVSRHRSENDTASQGTRLQRFLLLLQYKDMVRKHIVEKIKGKEIQDESFQPNKSHGEASYNPFEQVYGAVPWRRTKSPRKNDRFCMLGNCKTMTVNL